MSTGSFAIRIDKLVVENDYQQSCRRLAATNSGKPLAVGGGAATIFFEAVGEPNWLRSSGRFFCQDFLLYNFPTRKVPIQ